MVKINDLDGDALAQRLEELRLQGEAERPEVQVRVILKPKALRDLEELRPLLGSAAPTEVL